MARLFRPDYYFARVQDITVPFLNGIGISGVVLDIDNTLVYYDVRLPDAPGAAWMGRLVDAGFPVAFVSNANAARVEQFNSPMGFHAVSKAGKPGTKGFLAAAARMGLPPAAIAVIGDQVFTDVLGGNLAGMVTLLVKPIQMEPWLRFRIRRAFEKPILSGMPITTRAEESDAR